MDVCCMFCNQLKLLSSKVSDVCLMKNSKNTLLTTPKKDKRMAIKHMEGTRKE